MLRTFTLIALLATAAAAQAPKIGYVNFNRILEEWQVVKNFENDINARIESTQNSITALADELQALNKEIEDALLIYDPNSPEVKVLKDERRKKLAKLKATRDFNLAYLQSQVGSETLRFYNLAVRKIQDYAQKRGYDLILKVAGDDLAADDQATLKLKISYRTVIYHQAQNDLTDAIIAELNAN